MSAIFDLSNTEVQPKTGEISTMESKKQSESRNGRMAMKDLGVLVGSMIAVLTLFATLHATFILPSIVGQVHQETRTLIREYMKERPPHPESMTRREMEIMQKEIERRLVRIEVIAEELRKAIPKKP
jgi:hypothetical protein